MNIHPRRALHKSKTTSSSLSKAGEQKDEGKECVSVRSVEPMDLDNINNVVSEVSEAFKQIDITDIDADDFENPQLCAEYAREIYQYLLKYEVSQTENIKSIIYTSSMIYT